MDLTGWLLRIAAARPHVLVVAVPGAVEVRLAAEAELGRRGWPLAQSPADADLLLVAGTAGPRMSAVVETVWAQLPAPRVRIVAEEVTGVARCLDSGQRHLADAAAQRRVPPRDRPTATGADSEATDDDHRDMGGMEMPGGVPMADLGEDRDGLQLDALHVSIGPVLSDWPAGLVMHLVLQGDVITAAQARVLDPPRPGPSFWAAGDAATVGDVARRAAAGHLDGLARFLGVAGWPDPAARARRWRDALLAGEPAAEIAAPVRDLVARVARSRTLRWLVRGIPAGGRDVSERLSERLAALGAALELLEDRRPAAGADPGDPVRVAEVIEPDAMAAALVGAELAAARLVVAALDPDLSVPTREAVADEHR